MNTLKAFLPLFDLHMAVVVVMALVGTLICREVDLVMDLPADLVSIGVIFPLVFSIASAFTRREDALKNFASLKANAAALYFAHRDWPAGEDGLGRQGARLIHDLLARLSHYFKVPEPEKPEALM